LQHQKTKKHNESVGVAEQNAQVKDAIAAFLGSSEKVSVLFNSIEIL
jgi:hypothetical protein